MEQKSQTKDERYLLRLHELTQKIKSVDWIEVGCDVGLTLKGVKTVVTLLGQANLVKRNGPKIYLTERGRMVAEEL